MSSDELKNLTVGEFLHTLRQVVAEKGANYVYPESERGPNGICRYRRYDGQPSCIIGHVLDTLGVAVPPFYEGKNASIVLSDFGASEQVRRVAARAQHAQDNALSWGVALAYAEYVAKTIGVVP